jgi:hypothetical protein
MVGGIVRIVMWEEAVAVYFASGNITGKGPVYSNTRGKGDVVKSNTRCQHVRVHVVANIRFHTKRGACKIDFT